jgi:hypothetical protein
LVTTGKYKKEAVLFLTVQTFPKEMREDVPELGRTYIIFSYPKNSHQIRKVVAYSEENFKQAKAGSTRPLIRRLDTNESVIVRVSLRA